MRGAISKHFNLVRNICALLALTLLLLILFPVYIKEDSASAVTGTATTSSTSLTLTTSNTSANVTITPNSANGTFAMSSTSNEAKFSVTTNNYTGYELRIKADDDNGNLVNIDNGNTHTISSIPSSITKSSFDTTTYNNKWGYKPNKYLGPNSTIVTNTGDSALFLPSPTTLGTVLDHTTTPNTTANNYTIALGIRADHNTYAGTYSKTFTLVATANPTTYTINYSKNTTDTVSNMPSTSTTGSTTSTTINLPNTVPTRAHYSFLGWCSTTTTTSNGIDSCSGTVYNPNGAGTNLAYGLDQTTANTTTLYAMWKIDTFTCTKRYRLEKADGSWEAYQQEPSTSNDIVNYGGSCSYTKTITNYRGASNAANGAQGSTSASNITADTTLSLDIYRNTYTLTVSAGANTTVPSNSGAGTYRWEQTVTVYINKSANATCTSYAVPTWTQSGTAGTVGTTTQYSGNTYKMNFTMGNGNVVLTATSAASNVSQTITLSKGTGVNGITIDGTKYTGTSASLTCGQHTVTAPAANFNSGYEFSSWAISGSASLSSTSSATATMTVNGAGTLTLNGKSSKLWFQNATSAQCGQTMYDNRGTDAYKNIAYTTASINGLCWMTRNLDLPGGTTLTAADSNVSAGCNLGGTNNCTLPASSKSGFTDNSTAYVYNSNSTTCTSSSPCYSYYSYVAATAGTNPSSGEAASDICPKGWRLPTNAEYVALRNTYTTGATITASPFYGVYAGFYYSGSLYSGGSVGYHLSSTANDSSNAYFLSFASSAVNAYNNNKNRGFSVRCVAK